MISFIKNKSIVLRRIFIISMSFIGLYELISLIKHIPFNKIFTNFYHINLFFLFFIFLLSILMSFIAIYPDLILVAVLGILQEIAYNF